MNETSIQTLINIPLPLIWLALRVAYRLEAVEQPYTQRRTHVYTSGRRIMKMKTLEDIRAELLQSMQKAHSNDSSTGNASKISTSSTPEELQKASTVAQDALTAAVADYLSQSAATKNAAAALTAANASALKAPRGKRIKEKGIALCHESQGYSANLRPDSLLMKAGKPGISLQVNKAALIDAPPELLATLKRLGFETSI